MKIQAELSLYPLRIQAYENTIEQFIEGLSRSGITVVSGEMSTLIAGNNEDVFHAVSQCYARAASTDEVVLIAKFSNACSALKAAENEVLS